MRCSTICLIFIGFLFFLSTVGTAQAVYPWENDSLYSKLGNMPMVIDLRSLSLKEALKKYPDIISKFRINVTRGIGVGESVLYSVLPQYKPVPGKKRPKFKFEYVKEINWSIDKTFDITVWYKKDSSGFRPILDRIAYKGTMY